MKSTIARAGMLLAFSSTVAACGNSEQKLKELQTQADERVKKAEDDATQKVAAAQKEIDALKAQFAEAATKAKADADEALRVAKESADEQEKTAEKAAADALAKAREAYKAEARAKLKDINEDLSALSLKTAKAPAKVKATATKSLQDITKKEKEIAKDITGFDKAELQNFRTVKAKVEQDLAILKGKIKDVLLTLTERERVALLRGELATQRLLASPYVAYTPETVAD